MSPSSSPPGHVTSVPPPQTSNPLASPLLDGQAVFSVRGLSQQSLPLVVTSPHSGRNYPASLVSRSELSLRQLARNEDALVDALVKPMAEQGAVVLELNTARAYVDVNRDAEELDAALFDGLDPNTALRDSQKVQAGLGVVPSVIDASMPIYRAKLPFGEAERRLNGVYHPFHCALSELVSRTVTQFGGCLVVDCHSMPRLPSPNLMLAPQNRDETIAAEDQREQHLRSWGGLDAVIGDRFGHACDSWISEDYQAGFANSGLMVALNRPFAGGTITQRYGKRRDDTGDIQAIQIELARPLYLSDDLDANLDSTLVAANHPTRSANQQFPLVSRLLCDTTLAIAQKFAARIPSR